MELKFTQVRLFGTGHPSDKISDFGIKYFGSEPFNPDVKKTNIKTIFSNDYLGSLRTFIDEIQGLYIIKAEIAGDTVIRKVMLVK